MAYDFKIYLSEGREFFRWKSDISFTLTNQEIKKDFELSESLLDLLYLDMDDYFQLCNEMGEEIRKLYEKDSEKNISALKNGLDKLAEAHIYFEFVRLDWYNRLDKFVNGELKNLRKELYYKEITHIPMDITTWQNQLQIIFSKALDAMLSDKPVQERMSDMYNDKTLNDLSLFEFKPITTDFERINSKVFVETLNPKSLEDILNFFLRAIINQNLTFKACKSCGKYFPTTSHGNSEYCNRPFQNTDKTCKEIGSVKVYQAKINENPEFKAYNRAYKTHFARIKHKRMTKEEFKAWAELAREFRDQVTNGDMGLQSYEDWLKR